MKRRRKKTAGIAEEYMAAERLYREEAVHGRYGLHLRVLARLKAAGHKWARGLSSETLRMRHNRVGVRLEIGEESP